MNNYVTGKIIKEHFFHTESHKLIIKICYVKL